MPSDGAKRLRCAVYTRKSSEEGLEQEFNSLHAQREACEAYIRSQAGEGWRPLAVRYDDGAYSGGTMERPALQRLLADIGAGRVDTVVVYKVDRLTRSLADFAKIVEVFDARRVSFVSVTQQFNTTTSMGRLTLNMLLSFAQFEREVTGERIRDKIAASKMKGMWMGGFVPLGYEARDRTLTINESEAETVRAVYRLYLELGTVRRVKAQADRLGLRTKIRHTRTGYARGGRPLSRGYIYKLLGNPLYAGRIAHKGAVYDGRHDAIIDSETWDEVQAKLVANTRDQRSGVRAAEPSMLAGLLFDDHGERLGPSHAVKNGKRYRYYIGPTPSPAGEEHARPVLRIPAHEIETLVVNTLRDLIEDETRMLDLLGLGLLPPDQIQGMLNRAQRTATGLRNGQHGGGRMVVRRLVDQVTVADGHIDLAISSSRLRETLGMSPRSSDHDGDGVTGSGVTIRVPAKLRRRGAGGRLIIGDGIDAVHGQGADPAMLKALVRGHDWLDQLKTGQVESIVEIAREEGVTKSYVTRVMRLAFLAPDIVESLLAGRHPPVLSADRLIRSSRLPVSWHVQRKVLGFTIL